MKEKQPLKIIYIPTLGRNIMFWRVEHYARTLFNEYHGKRCFVNVECEGLFSVFNEAAWDYHVNDDTEQGKQVKAKLHAAFKFFDVIVFQKIQHEAGLVYIRELIRKFPNKRVLVDIDDSVGEITPSNYHSHKFKLNVLNTTCEFIRACDGVIASTEYLANSIKHLNDNVYIAPNCVSTDHEFFNVQLRPITKHPYRIGFVGAGGHDEDIMLAYKAMLPILDDTDCEFYIRYGSSKPSFIKDHPKISFASWSKPIGEYAQALHDLDLDLALAPLRDTEFNRCKSHLRIIENTCMGVPVVASDVEPYRSSKMAQVPGVFLTSNDIQKFTETIREAIKTPVSGLKLKYWTTKHYNIRNECSKLLDWFEKL